MVVMLVLVIIAGCATMGGPAPQKPQTALERAKLQSVYFLGWYKAQFKDAEAMGALAIAGKLSPGQLDVYRVKRKLLVEVKPLIDVYDALVAGGSPPSADKEQQILDIINRFGTLTGGAS